MWPHLIFHPIAEFPIMDYFAKHLQNKESFDHT